MSNVFFISDLHFGHRNILKFSPTRGGDTVEEHDEWLLEQINSTVKKRDVLWLLGDLAFSREGLEKVSKIHCQKHIILGNHDVYPVADYLKLGTLRPGLWKYKGFWLSHAPIHKDELRGKPNIHGHVHSQTIQSIFPIDDPNYINVCVEPLNGKPINIEEIRERRQDK